MVTYSEPFGPMDVIGIMPCCGGRLVNPPRHAPWCEHSEFQETLKRRKERGMFDPIFSPGGKLCPLIVKFKKLHQLAKDPAYATEHAAAVDLCSTEDLVVMPHDGVKMPTGLAVEIPVGYYLQISLRSGIASKNQLIIPNAPGIVDADYRGEVKVLLYNLTGAPVTIKAGDRIAQGCILKKPSAIWTEADELSETGRGAGGFGSTGK